MWMGCPEQEDLDILLLKQISAVLKKRCKVGTPPLI
jgi:hypothetical protein